jgi:hypothetical protein
MKCDTLFLQVLFTAELNRRLAAADIPVDALCLHPGNVMTEVVRSLPPLVQKLYRALLTHILFTPQEGMPQQSKADTLRECFTRPAQQWVFQLKIGLGPCA